MPKSVGKKTDVADTFL